MSGPSRPRLLIANRGEVACRIIHAAHALGWDTVLVASTIDYDGLAARQAGQVHLLEGDSLAQTYLNADAIVAAAKTHTCGLIHPGFGFLSEDADFAEAIGKAAITWVGPSPKSMRLVSDKMSAKKLAEQEKVPTAPWVLVDKGVTKSLLAEVEKTVGFPCLVKAIAGGGGKGLKKVEKPEDLANAVASAMREGKASFGDEQVFIEKIFERARHIEIQVFGDAKGNVHVFGERDCSAQRRFQKIIEESPGVGISQKLREQLEGYARKLAESIGYQNAGTVEFLLDLESGKPFFLEVNTRLQVEHGVTEERYGIDLVKMQLLTALGKPVNDCLPEGPPRGHVMELRLYAEDPSFGFLPQPGEVFQVNYPWMKGLRIETGLLNHDRISDQYDPMVAKLLVTGHDRADCLQNARYALQKTTVLGPTTNRDFLIDLLNHPQFADDVIATSWIGETFSSWKRAQGERLRELALALASHFSGKTKSNVRSQDAHATGEHQLRNLFASLGYGRERADVSQGKVTP